MTIITLWPQFVLYLARVKCWLLLVIFPPPHPLTLTSSSSPPPPSHCSSSLWLWVSCFFLWSSLPHRNPLKNHMATADHHTLPKAGKDCMHNKVTALSNSTQRGQLFRTTTNTRGTFQLPVQVDKSTFNFTFASGLLTLAVLGLRCMLWSSSWLIGASLSELHTSVTALQDACVCPVRPTIYRIFKLNERIQFCTHATECERQIASWAIGKGYC